MDNSRFDIQLIDNDLFISPDGDFVFELSDEQHIEDTINAFAGWWKENPADGVGIKSYLGAPLNTQIIAQNIRTQLNNDGYTVSKPTAVIDANGNLTINPDATI